MSRLLLCENGSYAIQGHISSILACTSAQSDLIGTLSAYEPMLPYLREYVTVQLLDPAV